MILHSKSVKSTSPVTLSSLPDEVLVKIIDDLQPISLYILSLLTKRFHYFCLPIFFLRHDIQDPSFEATFTIPPGPSSSSLQPQHTLQSTTSAVKHFDVLAALHIALFVKSIQKLSITFPHPCIHAKRMINFLRRVRKLVNKLSFVGEVTFIHSSPFYDSEYFEAYSELDGIQVASSMRDMAREFGILADTLMRKSCSAVTLGGTAAQSSTYKYWCRTPRTALGWPVSIFKLLTYRIRSRNTMLSGRGWEFIVSDQREMELIRQTISPASHTTQSTLCTLIIEDASNLFFPPFSSWTFGILQSASITNLTISNILLDGFMWKLILPAISKAVPALRTCTITKCCFIYVEHMLRFISEISTVASLTLRQVVGLENVPQGASIFWAPSNINLMPELTFISAPLDWLLKILRGNQKRPALEHIQIQPLMSHLVWVHFEAISIALPGLIRRINEISNPNPVMISFLTPEKYSFQIITPIIYPTCFASQFTPTDLEEEVSSPYITPFGIADAYRWKKYYNTSRGVLDFVQEVKVTLPASVESETGIEQKLLLDWIRLFPFIKRLDISTNPESMESIKIFLDTLSTSEFSYLSSVFIDSVVHTKRSQDCQWQPALG
ncbi:hypothetical protein BDQ12DRAFT_732876 [Crucibulum laeve]|uniref:F-box domain-containing protein n=1 Tax=Crucibulum laeve TaxID=68775 RepID=A0A5C3MLX8_9AGAR|nr:hypothetical protein BDQ12DRAFT_732876 [Crucibulum laeve]